MSEIHPDSVEFCYKHCWYGVVLMVRYAGPGSFPGDWEFGQWRKAKYHDLPKLKGIT